MLIIWRADFEGDDKQLEQLDRKEKELAKKYGYTVDGPFLPQDASLLYIMHGTVEQMSQAGREFIPWAQKEKIPVTPLRYEIAQTPEEFWGRR